MTGRVNAYREAVVSLVVRGPANVAREIDAVVDTGFNGFLTLPASHVETDCHGRGGMRSSCRHVSSLRPPVEHPSRGRRRRGHFIAKGEFRRGEGMRSPAGRGTSAQWPAASRPRQITLRVPQLGTRARTSAEVNRRVSRSAGATSGSAPSRVSASRCAATPARRAARSSPADRPAPRRPAWSATARCSPLPNCAGRRAGR